MIKISRVFIYLVVAMFCFCANVLAFPVPTVSPSEIAQQISMYTSQASSTASEISSTKDNFKKSVLAGVPGYLKAIESGDWNGLAKDVAKDGYNIYREDKKLKKQAKEKAQKEADKNAKEKAKAQEQGAQAAEKAVNENRDKAGKNKESKIKKALAWGKKQGASVGGWLNKGNNQRGVNKIIHGALGDSQESLAMTKAVETLSKQGGD